MLTPTNSCPSDEVLAAFIEGTLSGEERDALTAHFGGCQACRALVATLVRADDALSQTELPTVVAGDAGPNPRELELLAQSGRVRTLGRYELRGVLGAGAMGVVYEAWDPDLGRRVALKLLRPSLVAGEAPEESRARLWREAQAMARVTHPNVLTVHDVGLVGETVFFAMELVEGRTLREHLAEKPRRWSEILRTYLEAAEGLRAAHAAGLIHRDFKPDNVLVAKDGRVLVTDFGVARAERLPDAHTTTPRDDAPSAALTRAGALVGTPHYMSPEQLEGKPADARSDQFGFCVALFEALYGKRPFEGNTFDALRANVLAGRLQSAPVGRVPLLVERALRRGLALDPVQRHASMEALIASLRWLLPSNARRIGVALGLVVLLLGGLAAYGFVAERGEPCGGAGARIAEVWNEGVAEQLRARFLETGAPYAEVAAEGAARSLTAYAAAWAEGHRDACRAYHVRGEQSALVLDARMTCLSERRAQLRALVQTLLRTDRARVEGVAQAVGNLGDLASCADTRALVERRGDDPAALAAASALEGRKAEVQALVSAARFREAAPKASALLEAARRAGHAPLLAEVLLLRARAILQLGQAAQARRELEEALWTALGARDDETTVRVATDLAHPHPAISPSRVELERWLSLARAELRRLGPRPKLAAKLALAEGEVLEMAGDSNRALARYVEAERIAIPALGSEHMLVGYALNAQGHVLTGLARYREAAARLERALSLFTRVLGADHPRALSAQGSLGTLHHNMGDAKRALEIAEEVYARHVRVLGPEHSSTLTVLTNTANALRSLNRPAEALERLRRVLPGTRKALGAEHPRLANVLVLTGGVLGDLKRHEEAIAAYREALAIHEKTLGPDSPRAAFGHNGLGEQLEALGRYAEALTHFERARRIHKKAVSSVSVAAVTAYHVAEMLAKTSGDAARCARLAAEARRFFVSQPRMKEEVAEVDKMLAEAGPRCRAP